MTGSKLFHYLIFTALLTLCSNVYAQEAVCDNVKFEWLNSNQIEISYDLMGSVGQEYEVSIFLMMTGNELFKVKVKSAAGDLGGGIKSGINKRVVWNIYNDIENIVAGVEYYIAVDVEISSGSTWYYWVIGGAAAILGGVLGLGGGGDDGGGGTTPPTSGSFPIPPSR